MDGVVNYINAAFRLGSLFGGCFLGRTVFTILLVCLSVVLMLGTFAEGYYSFLFLGSMLGGATFVVGNAHVSSWYPKSRQGMALGLLPWVISGLPTV